MSCISAVEAGGSVSIEGHQLLIHYHTACVGFDVVDILTLWASSLVLKLEDNT